MSKREDLLHRGVLIRVAAEPIFDVDAPRHSFIKVELVIPDDFEWIMEREDVADKQDTHHDVIDDVLQKPRERRVDLLFEQPKRGRTESPVGIDRKSIRLVVDRKEEHSSRLYELQCILDRFPHVPRVMQHAPRIDDIELPKGTHKFFIESGSLHDAPILRLSCFPEERLAAINAVIVVIKAHDLACS